MVAGGLRGWPICYDLSLAPIIVMAVNSDLIETFMWWLKQLTCTWNVFRFSHWFFSAPSLETFSHGLKCANSFLQYINEFQIGWFNKNIPEALVVVQGLMTHLQ